jgi:hypothetical protein
MVEHKQQPTALDNLNAAKELLQEARQQKDAARSTEQLWEIAQFVMGTDHPDAPGCMNAEGALGTLQNIANDLAERAGSLPPHDQEIVRQHVDTINDRITAARNSAANIRRIQTGVRQSAGEFTAFQQQAA